MTKYIFRGGGPSLDATSNKTFYEELVRDVPQNGTVLLVYFASRSDDYLKDVEKDMQLCREGGKGKNLDIAVANKEDFMKQVDESDAIYLRGGSTQKLIDALKVYPNLKKHFMGKTIAGSSAGAYALSTLYSSHYEDDVAEGLGIVPVRVVTHHESEKMPPKPKAVEALKNTQKDLQLIILKEGEWEVVVE